MNARVHGGPDAAGVPQVDFSTNANACGPCPQALAAVQAADASHYPDPAYAQLRQALARHHGVDAWRIVLGGSGSELVFRLAAWAARSGVRSVAVPRHAYGDYAAAAAAHGMERVPAEKAGLVWACDPSSPLGQPEQNLQKLAAHEGIVALDLAYEPLRLEGVLGLADPSRDRVWQLWTPNKALGLTGVRAAYAIAPAHARSHVAALEALAPSWVVGAHGVALLMAWSEPQVQQWVQASRDRLRNWKQRQEEVLRALGWTCLPSVANFQCCRPGLEPGFIAALRSHGIKLRDCASFGLPGHVRLSVQPPMAQDALAAAWKAIR
jgi:histidinol-phosphate aminotransferase